MTSTIHPYQPMTFTLGISKLLQLRQQHGDQAVLDMLQVAMLLRYEPGIVTIQQLQQAWGVHQSNVSRRMTALRRQRLIDASSGYGGYEVHGLEVVA